VYSHHYPGIFAVTPHAVAAKQTWAKRAVAFPSQCDASSDGVYENQSPRTAFAPLLPRAACKPLRIPSPDGKSSVEIAYKKVAIDAEHSILEAFLRVSFRDKGIRETNLPEGFQDIDLLWSPD